jgi:hypothetical protein
VAPILEGHVSLDGTSYPIVRSQPIQHNWRWDDSGHTVELFRFCLNDLGHSEYAISAHSLTVLFTIHFAFSSTGGQATTDRSAFRICAPCTGNRPPRWLRPESGHMGSGMCRTSVYPFFLYSLNKNQVFELLTGRWLFNPSVGATWSLVDDHLSKMQEFTGETFSADLLSRARERERFFDKSGMFPLLTSHVVIGRSLNLFSLDLTLCPLNLKAIVRFALTISLQLRSEPGTN